MLHQAGLESNFCDAACFAARGADQGAGIVPVSRCAAYTLPP